MVYFAAALPIFDCGDRRSDRADCRRRDNSGLFLRVALDVSMVEGARRHDDLDASVVKEAIGQTGTERRTVAYCFVRRGDCRGASTHRMHHSVESHGGMSLLDRASANAPSKSQSRADIVCLVLGSSCHRVRFWDKGGGGYVDMQAAGGAEERGASLKKSPLGARLHPCFWFLILRTSPHPLDCTLTASGSIPGAESLLEREEGSVPALSEKRVRRPSSSVVFATFYQDIPARSSGPGLEEFALYKGKSGQPWAAGVLHPLTPAFAQTVPPLSAW